jgi:DNA-binding MarR family transcriptional regulator
MMFDDDILLFIHEPARLLLLTHLAAVKSADFVFLTNCTGLSRGNLSVQTSRLQERGFVTIEKTIADNRPRTVYAITRAGRAALRRYRKQMFAMLESLSI